MRLLYRRCAGFNIHKKSISACIRVRVHSHKVESVTEVFGTVTQELERQDGWLAHHHVKHVAMESTGADWVPVWKVLETHRRKFELVQVYAAPRQITETSG